MSKITIVICTKDRPKDMNSLLTSLKEQTSLPDDMIIIDGSDTPEPVEEVVYKFKDSLPLSYQTLRPTSLTRQRNEGISKVSSDTDWIGFLDDDLVLEKDAIENLRTFLDKDKEVRGVGLIINNQEEKAPSLIRSLLLTDKSPGGVFTLSGLPASIRPVKDDLQVEWLYGGATFWHKSILNEVNYDEWFSGVGYSEDVDFSYRVAQKHKLMLHSRSRCWHYHHQTSKEKLIKLGTWQIVSWWYFISKTNSFNKVLVLYSMLGVMATNLLIGIVKPSSHRTRNALGNLKGLCVILFGNVKNHQGFQK